MAYVDVYQLRRSDIIDGVDGSKWIVTTRQKTESATRLPLLPAAVDIMNKCVDDPKCVIKDLKEIADCCGIKKNLTFHIARHTFATTVTLSNG